ncbi:MAG: hypothetical protein LBH00_10865 [Planctomycetaceae bacterium]|nr:hypothetical protein [Planctomycetaceae bacterium]
MLKTPLLTKGKIHDFWGGVHKQFILKEEHYFIKIHRNYRYNTILSFIGISCLGGEPTFYEDFGVSPWVGNSMMRMDLPDIPKENYVDKAKLAAAIWKRINASSPSAERAGFYRKTQLMAYQTACHAALDGGESEKQLAKVLSWRFLQWTKEQIDQWEADMKEAERQFRIRDPKFAQDRDEFLANPNDPKQLRYTKMWESDTHEGYEGVRFETPKYDPVPEELKRKPSWSAGGGCKMSGFGSNLRRCGGGSLFYADTSAKPGSIARHRGTIPCINAIAMP